MKTTATFLAIALFAVSCGNSDDLSDAYGNFEAKGTIISSEAMGKILRFDMEEGQELTEDLVLGLVDSTPLSLKKEQVLAQMKAISAKHNNITAQVNVLKEQKLTLLTEKTRLQKLLADGAATPQQMDQLTGKLNVLDKQITTILTNNSNVFSELEVMTKGIAQLQNQINRCVIVNPINGTVLEKYAEPFEMAIMGKPLYKIADLSQMYLRVYISGQQLPHINIGQQVQVLIDDSNQQSRTLPGTVSWIAEQAEFTPKIIQTKEERINLVYAVKILVPNNGSLKVGMPGEVNFQ